MSDAAGFGEMLMTARLVREIDAVECMQRNALSVKRQGLKLKQGAMVTVLETLDQGNAFLVEFAERSEKRAADKCDWLGVLYPAEIEFVTSKN